MTQGCDFKDPDTIKDILDLLAKLEQEKEVEKSVSQKILNEVTVFCKDTDAFYKSGSQGSLYGIFSGSSFIRQQIVSRSGSYGNYEKLEVFQSECIAKALKTCLPKLFAALQFFNFNASSDLSRVTGAGTWSSQQCNQTSQYLGKWLIDQIGKDALQFIPRGFGSSSNLSSNNGSNVASIVSHVVSYDSAKNLQTSLCYMLFVCDWHDSLTGHALLFLSMLCEKVKGGNGLQGSFNGNFEDFDMLKEICKELEKNLEPLVRTHNSDAVLRAVCHNNAGLYSKVFSPELFQTYLNWLKGKLGDIIDSLNQMASESGSWDPSSLNKAESGGPFKYGFVIKNDVSDWENKKKFNLTSQIKKLTEANTGFLDKLKKFLNDESSATSSGLAAGSAAGFVGAGGVGAGVAYATNAFGLKDIISGIIGGFMK